MCMNDYRSKSERSVKLVKVCPPKGILPLDTHTALLAQIELLNKKLVCIRTKVNYAFEDIVKQMTLNNSL